MWTLRPGPENILRDIAAGKVWPSMVKRTRGKNGETWMLFDFPLQRTQLRVHKNGSLSATAHRLEITPHLPENICLPFADKRAIKRLVDLAKATYIPKDDEWYIV